MTIPVSSCTTTIQVWVDTNALTNGSTAGIYVVDNRLNWGSSNEGTPTLSTDVTKGTNICWQLSIQNIGNAAIWGASGQPQQINSNTWTGQVQATGNHNPYLLVLNAQASGGSGITASLNLSMTVQ